MTVTTRHHHEDLAISQCWDLLRHERIGRVALNDTHGIQVFPVSYVVHGKFLYFRTSPYGALGRHVSETPVSFEVDQFDDFNQSAWSVLVIGVAQPVKGTDLLTELWGQSGPEPWAGGVRSMFISIAAKQVTGRRVYPTADPTGP